MTDRPDWNDEPMDARLRELAREYNSPGGVVPREAMWQAIAPAVRAAAHSPEITPDIAPSVTRTRRHIAPYAWGAALAAGLVLGIMLEREVLAPRAGTAVATTPRSVDSQEVASSTPIPTVVANAPARTAVAPANAPKDARRTTPVATASGPAPATRRGATDDGGSATDDGANAQQLYRLAARQTLVQAEALLTAYRASDDRPRDQESMQQAGRWARDVLTSTRLLLDSPAGSDPQMRALFTDLELVLAQIVQLSGAPLQAGERELIERAMRDRDLLPRLRSALPAGATTE
ncbi:MAG TPA: hypothetical protein VFY85_04925 [Gemmatimonadaceae bacterium]|nr:hypothetical protein [Gemmatimonadaceae bacterium]